MKKTPVMIVQCRNAALSTCNKRVFNKSVSGVVLVPVNIVGPVPVAARSKAWVCGR